MIVLVAKLVVINKIHHHKSDQTIFNYSNPNLTLAIAQILPLVVKILALVRMATNWYMV